MEMTRKAAILYRCGYFSYIVRQRPVIRSNAGRPEIAVHRSIFYPTQFDSPDLRPDLTRPADNKNKSSAVAEMGERLATIDMGRKWEGLLWGLGPHWVPI